MLSYVLFVDITGRAVIVSIDVMVDGCASLLLGRRSELLVMVICDGRDFSVCMSIPDIERIDSCDVERRNVGCNEVDQCGSESKGDACEISESVTSSTRVGTFVT